MNGSATPEGDQLVAVVGQRRVGDVEQQVVLPEAERQRDAEDRQRDDHPAAKLVEVLDEGQAVLVRDRLERGPSAGPSGPLVGDYLALDRLGLGLGLATARSSRISSSSSSSSLSPVTEPLNSRIPLPSERPSSGRRLGPKTTGR